MRRSDERVVAVQQTASGQTLEGLSKRVDDASRSLLVEGEPEFGEPVDLADHQAPYTNDPRLHDERELTSGEIS